MSDNGKKDKDDLTRLEDLTDFTHEEDEELDQFFAEHAPESESQEIELEESDPFENDSFSDFESEQDSTEDDEIEFSTEEQVEDILDEDAIASEQQIEEMLDEDLFPDDQTASLSFDTSELQTEEEIQVPEPTELELPSADDLSYPEEILTEDEEAPSPERSKESEQTPISQSPIEEIADISEKMVYGEILSGGNPPFSIALTNIKFHEDAEKIFKILQEHGLVTSDNETIYRQSLDHGNLLISQLTEYCAIFLAHKLRRFSVDLKIGPSELVFKPETYTEDAKGLIHKDSLEQNKAEFIVLKQTKNYEG